MENSQSHIRGVFCFWDDANDPRVLKIESDEIIAGIKANGITVEYVVFDDEGQGFRKKENEIEGCGKVLTFLETYLKGEE